VCTQKEQRGVPSPTPGTLLTYIVNDHRDSTSVADQRTSNSLPGLLPLVQTSGDFYTVSQKMRNHVNHINLIYLINGMWGVFSDTLCIQGPRTSPWTRQHHTVA